MFKATSLKTFFFPDDTKIKVECTTDVAYNAETGKLRIHRKFYTMRSLATFAFWYFVKNPIAQAKEIFKERPAYGLQYVTAFALFFLAAFDLKNLHHVTLIAGAIAFDATANTRSSTSPLTFNHTCTGANGVLTVGASGVRQQDSCTYNSVSMTGATQESDGSGWSRLFYLGSPATGVNSVSLTLNSNGDTMTGAISFSGANASSPLDTETTGNAGGTGTLTLSLTTNYANSFLVDTIHKQANATVDAAQTLRWSGTADYYAGSTKATTTAGAKTMQWTGTAATWGGAAIAIREYVAVSLPPVLKIGQAVKRAAFW